MTRDNHRVHDRKASLEVQRAVIFRDRTNLSYAQAMERVGQRGPLNVVFNVIAIVRDASLGGMGITFEGQQKMGLNLLEEGESYLVKLHFHGAAPPTELQPIMLPEEIGFSFVVKAICRWRRIGGPSSSAGFAIADATPVALRQYLEQRVRQA